jgi:predicted porin
MTAPGLAMAQSTVTLYGVIDESILIDTNRDGGRVIRLSDNGIRGNRVGLIGTEHLANGNAAIFRIENGFNATTGSMGQGARLFGSQAYAGLAGPVGTFLAGRQINTDASLIAVNFAAATQWAGVLGAHPGDVDNLYDTFRVPGALKYVAPTAGGLEFQMLYAPGSVAGHLVRGQVASAAISYSIGHVSMGASYNNAQTPNVGIAAGTANADLPIDASNAYYVSPVDSGFSSARTYQVFSLATSYANGPLTLGVLYTNTQFRGMGDPSSGPNALQYTGNAVFHNIELNGRYSISPAFSVGAAYNVTTRNSVSTLHRPEGLGSARYIQLVVGIRYILQKTVFLYAEAMIQQASGVDSTGQIAVATNSGLGSSSSARQGAVRAGLNVSF